MWDTPTFFFLSSSLSIPALVQQPQGQFKSPIANPSNFTLQLSNAIFSGGGEILRHQNYPQFGYIPPGSVSLRTQKVYNTENDRIFKLEGRLNFQGLSNIVFNSTHRRLLRLVSYRPPRIPVRPNQARFRLHGFWSSASGKLCMVGSGVSYLRSVNVVLELNYPDSSNIFTSFVNGTLQNLDQEGALNYFKPIEILGVSLRRYNFILIERENQSGGFSAYDKLENVSIGFEMGQEVCSVIRIRNKKGHTTWGYSSPLSVGDKFYKPPLVFSKPTESVTDGNHSNNSMLNISYVISFKNNPKLKLGGGVTPMKFVEISAEGIYDAKTGVLCMIGCRRLALPYKIQKNDNLDCEIVVNAEYPPLNAKDGGNVKGFIESTEARQTLISLAVLRFTQILFTLAKPRNPYGEWIWRSDATV